MTAVPCAPVRRSASLLFALALALAAAGCGGDDSPTGGGGGGASTLSLRAGTYQLNTEIHDCTPGGSTVVETVQDVLSSCAQEVVDEFFGYDCPVRRNGNNLSLACERSYPKTTGCTETARLYATGTVTGDHYELFVTIDYTDDPADCWEGSHCDSLYITIERIADAPSACAFAGENTVALSVTGGPRAGSHTLDAFGDSDESGPNIAFSFNASSSTVVAGDRGAAGEVATIFLSAYTPYLDPEALPIALPVTVLVPGAAAAVPSAGGPEVLLTYYEQTLAYQFFAEDVVSGGFVVHEIDTKHVAGTLDVTLAGTAYNSQYPEGTPAQRTLSGGYYVIGSELVTRPGTGFLSTDTFARQLERRHH